MKISILGTGAFGIALASIFHDNKCQITMWTNSTLERDELLRRKKNNKINYIIPNDIKITCDMKEAISKSDIIVIAVPTEYVRNVTKEFSKYYQKKQIICIASKGIEQNTCLFLYDVVKEYIDTTYISIISGGTFAIDIISKVPVGFTLATRSSYAKKILTKYLENNYVKARSTKDIIGTEICGSIKNVIAIASGMLDGMNYPISTSSMFITESLHDIKALIHALGGSKKTILSFAGFGDLLLTCTSTKSRNYTLGRLIGEGKSKEEINEYIKNTTIEGLYTLKAIKKLLKNKKIKMPIINLIYDIIVNNKNPNELINFLINKE